MKNTKKILVSFFNSQQKGELITRGFITDRIEDFTEGFLDEIFGDKKNNISVYAEYLVVSHPTREYFLIVKINDVKQKAKTKTK